MLRSKNFPQLLDSLKQTFSTSKIISLQSTLQVPNIYRCPSQDTHYGDIWRHASEGWGKAVSGKAVTLGWAHLWCWEGNRFPTRQDNVLVSLSFSPRPLHTFLFLFLSISCPVSISLFFQRTICFGAICGFEGMIPNALFQNPWTFLPSIHDPRDAGLLVAAGL